jgi:glucose-6-phosphate isomerase
MTPREQWDRYKRHLCVCDSIGLTLDISRMGFDSDYLASMTPKMQAALDAMAAIEKGAVANVDEKRMVGHYWLRAAELAPDPAVTAQIVETIKNIKSFAHDVQEGRIHPQRGEAFFIALVVGIGGSALGPQFVLDALGGSEDLMLVRFLDNTDPDGIDRTLADLDESLAETLTIVISKSGGTKETRNGMVEVEAAYKRAGLDFGKHAVAITGEGSALHKIATEQRWLRTFPMWDWVGGRTSVLSAVGLLPAALQGLHIEGLLHGAAACDQATRERDIARNPAALMALMWHYAAHERGIRDMVALPYADRLLLLGRYLQQLIMESLGKERDRSGATVHEGLTVYGNKGSTDQHAYVQQLRDGVANFFVTFIEVLRQREGKSMIVENGATTGDYLAGFLHGTRAALTEKGRESMTITLDRVDAHSVGVIIALFERAVGLYAELVNINAYHQPGVEAGKLAAERLLVLQQAVVAHMLTHKGKAMTAEEVADAVGQPERVEDVLHTLEHAAANDDRPIRRSDKTRGWGARFVAE